MKPPAKKKMKKSRNKSILDWKPLALPKPKKRIAKKPKQHLEIDEEELEHVREQYTSHGDWSSLHNDKTI